MTYPSIEKLLMTQSVKREHVPWIPLMAEGLAYDQSGPEVKEHIQSFIDAYELPMDELLVQDLDQYPVSSDAD